MTFKNWKAYTTAFGSLLMLAIPQNGFTCADAGDPYDYYTSFFSKNNNEGQLAYQPFYYTSLLTFYDDQMEADIINFDHDPIIKDWQSYCKNATAKDVSSFVYKSTTADLKAVADYATTHKPLPTKLQNNTMAQWLLKENNKPAIDYLLFAKRTEQFSTQSAWDEPKKPDSLALNRYIAQANENYGKTTDPFIKDRYAYQQCKLAFYNHRYTDCIKWYDLYFKTEGNTALNINALTYKAGSLYHRNKSKEAAYYFSRAFVLSEHNKKQIFQDFLWSTEFCKPELVSDYITLCKNDKEKAAMLGMFALYGTSYKPDILDKVYTLDPSSPLLPVLATREINKIEEQYFTPLTEKEVNKTLYTTYVEDSRNLAEEKPQVVKTIKVLEKLGSDRNSQYRAFYNTGAAYLHFITKDYTNAKNLLKEAKKGTVNNQLNDQIQMISLLIVANENKTIDKEAEKQLLGSMQWITDKAKANQEYRMFFRNFFAQVLAHRYIQQGDLYKATLAYGLADERFIANNDVYDYYGNGINFLRNDLSTEQLLKLYNLMGSRNRTGFEDYLITYTSFKQDDVTDVIGTAYLRDHQYSSAIEWLKKMNKPTLLTVTNYNYQTGKEVTINPDPFYDYLNDWQRYTKLASKPYTKLSLAEKLVDLQSKIDTAQSAETKSKLYYQFASAMYNMSYYGNSWQAVTYDRSGSDWNSGNYKEQWKKEYYGVYEARKMYQKAYDISPNKEFKGACMFMIIKCAQRQIPRPEYDYNNSAASEKQDSIYNVQFMNSPLFPAFIKEFGDTKFYKYTYNRCSYLRDFVARRK